MKKNSKTKAKQKVVTNKTVNASRQAAETVDSCLASSENQCTGGMCAVSWKPKRSAA
jgi:hypothetical protein